MHACDTFSDYSFYEKIEMIADNDKSKSEFIHNGKEKAVSSIDKCLRVADKKPILLITVLDCLEIIEQLERKHELNDSECYIYTYMLNYVEPYELPLDRAKNEPQIIPKIIHYCWFGGNPISSDSQAYIETWKKHCPDYEIVRWDESNYDFKKNEYMYEAHKLKKWAFVSDYARLDIVLQHGGVYLDADVELIRSIDDLLCDKAFCGFEGSSHVANGLGFGAVPRFQIVFDLLSMYDMIQFVNSDKSLNLKPGPQYQTEYFVANGLVLNNTLQIIDSMTVYPSDVLAPLNYRTRMLTITNNTYAIHHYLASWVDEIQKSAVDKLAKKNVQIAKSFEK